MIDDQRVLVYVSYPRAAPPDPDSYSRGWCQWTERCGGKFMGCRSLTPDMMSEWHVFDDLNSAARFVEYTRDFLAKWPDTCRGERFQIEIKQTVLGAIGPELQ
jgi:hypothetical protein